MRKWWMFDKWIASAVLYVVLVIAGFTAYEEATMNTAEIAAAKVHESEGNHEQSSHSDYEGRNEVITFLKAGSDGIDIFLKDLAGNPIQELEISHEKIFHLIIVDEQLKKYHHVHPEQTGAGQFYIAQKLPEGFYKAFIDIKPKDLEYHVKAIPFVVGHPGNTNNEQGLQPDHSLIQQVDGESVTLNMSSLEAKTPVTLSFELDKTAQRFPHVHPANQEEPIFQTEFGQPGLYKIWAEFKQNGKVRVFPFVIEIKGEK